MCNVRTLSRWSSRNTFVAGSLGIILSLVALAVLAQADPIVGTWRMNLAASKFSPGPGPREPGVTRIEAVPGGLKLVNDGVNAEGQRTHLEYTAMFDGKDYPSMATVEGAANPNAANTNAIRRIDSHNYEVTAKRDGEMRTVTRWVVSADGRTRTNTVTGKNAQGQTVNDTVVWDKQ